MSSNVRRVFCAVAGLMAGVVSASGADAIRVSGSTTVNAAVFSEHKAEIEAAVGQPILVTPNGSGNGLKDLVEGRADVAMLSSVLAKVAAKANIDPHGLNQFPLVDARLVFIVHPSNPVKSLTLDQVKSVMAGTISNWKQLGGPDLGIVGIVETVGGGVRMVTEEGVMQVPPHRPGRQNYEGRQDRGAREDHARRARNRQLTAQHDRNDHAGDGQGRAADAFPHREGRRLTRDPEADHRGPYCGQVLASRVLKNRPTPNSQLPIPKRIGSWALEVGS